MGVEFKGDWDKVLGMMDNAGENMKSASSRGIARSTAKAERKILDHMDAQDLDWEELSKPYADKKEKEGLDPDTLRATNEMYENITTAHPDEFTGLVGVTRGVKTKDGEDITDIALIHEQPDDDGVKMPARKLWKPTFEEIKDDVAAELKGAAIEVFTG